MSWFSRHPIVTTGIIGGSAAIAWGISKLIKLKKFDSDSTVTLRLGTRGIEIKDYDFNPLSFKLGNVYFYTDVVIDYPNEKEISLSTPYIRLYSNGIQIGNSIPVSTSYTLKLGRNVIPNIAITIPLSKIIGQIKYADFLTLKLDAWIPKLQSLLKEKTYEASTDIVIDGISISKKDVLQKGTVPYTPTTAGLGLTAGRRNIKDGSAYNKFFPKAEMLKIALARNASTEKTVKLMAEMVNKYAWQCKAIAKELQSSTKEQSLKNIWNFVYTYIQYAEEPGEFLRTPARSWADRKSGIDCDCMAIFQACILKNMGIDYEFRITKYYGRNYYQHVYIIVPETMEAPI